MVIICALVLVLLTVVAVLLMGYRITSDNGIKFIGKFENGQPVKGYLNYPGDNDGYLDKANNTITFDDGSKYVGDIDFLCRHGDGKMTFANGDVYEGEWEDDTINGEGVRYYSNGDVYTGEFKDGVAHGKGKSVVKATETRDGMTYEGEYKDGLVHGQGTCIWDNGSIYTGSFSEGARHGYGELQLANEDSSDAEDGTNVEEYKGYWVNDKKEGADGELHYTNGDKYFGPFINDKPDTRAKDAAGNFVMLENGKHSHNVKGMYFYADGRTYTGYFEEGKIVTAEGELVEDTTPDYIFSGEESSETE